MSIFGAFAPVRAPAHFVPQPVRYAPPPRYVAPPRYIAPRYTPPRQVDWRAVQRAHEREAYEARRRAERYAREAQMTQSAQAAQAAAVAAQQAFAAQQAAAQAAQQAAPPPPPQTPQSSVSPGSPDTDLSPHQDAAAAAEASDPGTGVEPAHHMHSNKLLLAVGAIGVVGVGTFLFIRHRRKKGGSAHHAPKHHAAA